MIHPSMYSNLVEIVLGGYKKATFYQSPKEVAKATFQGKRDKRSTRSTIILTTGRPNYTERKFIKDCLKAGEPFPIKKIQIKNK
jgi:hypothetical protein